MIPPQMFDLPGAYSPQGEAPSPAEQRAGIEFKKERRNSPSGASSDRRPVFRKNAVAMTLATVFSLGLMDAVFPDVVFPSEALGETQRTEETRASRSAHQVSQDRVVLRETFEADGIAVADSDDGDVGAVAACSSHLNEIYAAMESGRPLDRPADFEERASRVAENQERNRRPLNPGELAAWSERLAEDLSSFED